MTSAQIAQPVDFPQPIRLHWAFVLILGALTAGLFGAAWLIVQANWVRKVRGGWLAEGLAISNACVSLVVLLAGRMHTQAGLAWAQSDYADGLVFAFWVAAVYTLRAELVAEPIGLFLGWFAPFFFGPVYFQYHLQEFGKSEEAGRPLGL